MLPMHDTGIGPSSPELAAWHDLTGRAAALGDRLINEDFPSGPADRADGFAHIAQQLICWLGWSVFHADARRPFFQRQNDLVTPWGGPNADNVYRHARVSADRRYRIRGRMNSCEEFMLAVRAGFMHEERWGTLHAVAATDLGIAEGDDFELTVGGGDADIPLPEGAAMVSIREYYYDWRATEPATFTIECIDDDAVAPAGRLDAATLARRLEAAVTGTEHSIENWNRYLLERRAEGTANTFNPPHRVAKGLAAARYAFCFFDLGPGDALIVETDVPDARYWSFQLYELAWYELIDPYEHQTSLNHRQARVDADGRLRVVVSAQDPGVANWLDTGGRRNGLLTMRWFWPNDDPDPTTRVLPISAVEAALPPDVERVDATGRVGEMQRRRAHLSWRFRT